MRKWQLVAAVSTAASVPKTTAELAVSSVFGEIVQGLERGEVVSIVGFGSFSVKDRAERVGRNPRTGQPVVIEARRMPRFKPAKALCEVVTG